MPRTTLRRPAALAAGGLLAALALSACGGGTSSASAGGSDCKDPATKVTIAYQPGIGYAPLLIAQQQKSLEAAAPGVTFTFRELSSGAAIRDGMLSGDIQIGAGGTAPFLVGYDGGVKWKVLTGLDDIDLQIMAKDPKITSVAGLKGKGSIAMPAPDSIQSVVLRKAAAQELGDAHALDTQIVALAHPDGVQALIAGQIAGHVTAPPFQGQEAAKGAHAVGDSYALFGKHTTNSAFALTSFAACNPKVTDAVVAQVAAADTMLTQDPAGAAALLTGPLKSTAEALQAQITDPGVTFTPTPTGFGTFATFMQQIGLIKKVPTTQDLFFANASTAGAN